MRSLIAITLVLAVLSPVRASGVYQTPEAFLKETFRTERQKPEMIWLTGERGKSATQILQHRPDSLRTRYWHQAGRTAWILDEIGKDKPITVGIVVNQQGLEKVKVLVFRESRGDEVRHEFFTRQFKQARLGSDKQLDKNIDGITGATLSVRALTRLSRLALYLHQQVVGQNDTP